MDGRARYPSPSATKPQAAHRTLRCTLQAHGGDCISMLNVVNSISRSQPWWRPVPVDGRTLNGDRDGVVPVGSVRLRWARTECSATILIYATTSLPRLINTFPTGVIIQPLGVGDGRVAYRYDHLLVLSLM